MPELPDVTVYVERIRERVVGSVGTKLDAIRLASPFVLRSFDPKVGDVVGRAVVDVRRVGKRIVLCLDSDFFVIVHLMVAGRFRWEPRGAKVPGKVGLAAFDFTTGTLLLTEVSTKKRASIHLAHGAASLAQFDRGGLEPVGCSLADFTAALIRERHTLKRTLTDPTLFSGIGNAYSDEILHRAKLSPVTMSDRLGEAERLRLHAATQATLLEWTARLDAESTNTPARWPDRVTAFRPEMAVHGKYGEPCPVCGTKVQRIVHAENETNYCPTCQTGGKLLADRSLSRLLKGDWPKTLEELEERKRGG